LFGGNTYNALTNIKIDIVFELVFTYKQKVIFTDDDIVWIHPKIIDYMNYLLIKNKNEIVFSSDNWDNPSQVCTGFYAILPTNFTIKLLKTVINESKYTNLNDQWIFWKILRSAPEIGQNLPLLWFQNGQVFINGQVTEYQNVTPWIFHANWVKGKNNKIALLKLAGYWYLNDNHSMLTSNSGNNSGNIKLLSPIQPGNKRCPLHLKHDNVNDSKQMFDWISQVVFGKIDRELYIHSIKSIVNSTDIEDLRGQDIIVVGCTMPDVLLQDVTNVSRKHVLGLYQLGNEKTLHNYEQYLSADLLFGEVAEPESKIKVHSCWDENRVFSYCTKNLTPRVCSSDQMQLYRASP
jgi:hypothetical protein